MHVNRIVAAAEKVAQARVTPAMRQGYLAGYEARCQARGADVAAVVKSAGLLHAAGKGLGWLGGKFKAIRQAGKAAPAAAAAAPAAAPAAAAAAPKAKGIGNAIMTSAPVRGVRGFMKDLGGGRARHLGDKLNRADQALASARNALQLPAGAGAADTAAFNELLAPLTQRADQLRRLHQQAVAARFKARLGAGGAAGAYMLGKNRGYGAAGEAALNDYYG